MKRKLPEILMLACGFFMAVLPVMAHHAFASQFDGNKKITLTGTVTKVEWLNPHIYIYIDVKENGGKVANWAIEGGSPNGLLRSGWTRNSVQVGDEVTVEGFPARNGSNLANMGSVTKAGKKVLGRIEGPEVGR